MAYIELIVEVERGQAEALSDSLIEAGALSASVEDADAGGIHEQPLFGEPGGEPAEAAWNRSIIVALFDEAADIDSAMADACIQAGLPDIPANSRRNVAEQDWVRLTQAQFDPIHVGERLWIVPSWHSTPAVAVAQSDALVLQLDPGLAFGTGSHPTTRLCMAWLEANLQAGARVIDYGCGSGILAIAAKKLGAGVVIGTDIDAHAVSASISNAAINGVDANFFDSHDFHAAPADVVVANILSNPLKVLAPLLCDLVRPGGSLVLSGILERQWQDVAAVYAPMVDLRLWRVEDGWVCLAGSRRAGEPDQAEGIDGQLASPSTPVLQNVQVLQATRCPACETVFGLSPDAARAQGGMVRCGVCAHPFDSLNELVDLSEPEPTKVVEPEVVEPEVVEPEVVEPEVVEPEVVEPEVVEPEVVEAEVVEAEAITPEALEPEAEVPVAVESEPPEVVEPVLAEIDAPPVLSPELAEPVISEPASATPLIGPAPEPVFDPAMKLEASFLKKHKRRKSSRGARLLLGLLGTLALLALAGQATYLWRNEIAALWPPVKPWLSQACIALRCNIETPAHIERLSIESAELQTLSQRDTYAYTALLRNRSSMAQRYPAIELALTDSDGLALLRRVIHPEEYLTLAQRSRLEDGLAANSELPVRVEFETPGNRATGFKSMLFYP